MLTQNDIDTIVKREQTALVERKVLDFDGGQVFRLANGEEIFVNRETGYGWRAKNNRVLTEWDGNGKHWFVPSEELCELERKGLLCILLEPERRQTPTREY